MPNAHDKRHTSATCFEPRFVHSRICLPRTSTRVFPLKILRMDGFMRQVKPLSGAQYPQQIFHCTRHEVEREKFPSGFFLQL